LKRVGLQYADYRKKPLPPPGSAANKVTEADRPKLWPVRMTRRADHRHGGIIAKVLKPALATAAGFFIS
jgi:hypothetical protein